MVEDVEAFLSKKLNPNVATIPAMRNNIFAKIILSQLFLEFTVWIPYLECGPFFHNEIVILGFFEKEIKLGKSL